MRALGLCEVLEEALPGILGRIAQQATQLLGVGEHGLHVGTGAIGMHHLIARTAKERQSSGSEGRGGKFIECVEGIVHLDLICFHPEPIGEPQLVDRAAPDRFAEHEYCAQVVATPEELFGTEEFAIGAWNS